MVPWSAVDKLGSKHHMCRRVGAPLCGRPNCASNKRPYPGGQHGRGRKRISEYQTRLLEKQKLRWIYGVSEAQMRHYYDRASRGKGVTGEEMIRQLETRLDTVVLRLGFALTNRQARQLVSHGHVLLDGKRLNVPSARVKPGQVVEISPKAKNFVAVREALEITPEPPAYLYRNKDQVQGTLSRLPDRTEVPLPVEVEERLIVEFYS
jgi:small subunit ribosomal protein S4